MALMKKISDMLGGNTEKKYLMSIDEDKQEIKNNLDHNVFHNKNDIKNISTTNKQNNTNTVIMIIIIFVGIYFLFKGINYKIPSKLFSFNYIEKYVGGDAYNAIIEAALRGGEISGATISKTIYICSGIITMAIGFLGLNKN